MSKKLKKLKHFKTEEDIESFDEISYDKNQGNKKNAEYLQEDEYNVEQICDMKVEGGKKLYFIKWEGFPHSQNTWEPIEHLSKVFYMVEQFEEEYAKQKSMQDDFFFQGENFTDDFPLKKKKTKIEPLDGQEVITKKRRLEKSDENGRDFEKIEKRVTSALEKSLEEDIARLGEEDAFMEISYEKEPPKQEKKKLLRPFSARGSLEEEDFNFKKDLEKFPDDLSFPLQKEKEDNKLSKDQEEDPFRLLVTEKFGGLSPEKAAKTVPLNAATSEEKTSPLTSMDSPTMEVAGPEGTVKKDAHKLTLKSILARKQQQQQGKGGAGQLIKGPPRKKDKTGSFKNKDKPKSILSIKPRRGGEGGLDFLVEWHRRSDGVQPENSMVSSEDMKQNDPYFLIDYYESKLVQVPKHNKQKRKSRENELEQENRMEIEKELGEIDASLLPGENLAIDQNTVQSIMNAVGEENQEAGSGLQQNVEPGNVGEKDKITAENGVPPQQGQQGQDAEKNKGADGKKGDNFERTDVNNNNKENQGSLVSVV